VGRRLLISLEKEISKLKLRYIGIIEEHLSGPLIAAFHACKGQRTSLAADTILSFYRSWDEYLKAHRTVVFNDENVMKEMLKESKGLILPSYKRLSLYLSEKDIVAKKSVIGTSRSSHAKNTDTLESDLTGCFIYQNLNV
jgi:hypothetical protein